MGTLANSENPDEMPQNVAFHQGLHVCLLTQKRSPGTEIVTSYYRIFEIQEGQFHTYCINLYVYISPSE